jgi:hypothetical protein
MKTIWAEAIREDETKIRAEAVREARAKVGKLTKFNASCVKLC